MLTNNDLLPRDSLVTQWKRSVGKKGITFTAAVASLNNITGYKTSVAGLGAMERGERNVPATVQQQMLNDCIHDIFFQFGIDIHKLTTSEWIELVKKLSPPTRR